jgi:hypothetical protein
MHMYIHISPLSHLHACKYTYGKGLVQNSGNAILLGACRTGVWTESVILAGQVFLPPEAVLQPLFSNQCFEVETYEQFGWCWLWSTLLLISASWVPKITEMRHWDWDLFVFCVTKTELELNNFLLSWGLNSGVRAW